MGVVRSPERVGSRACLFLDDRFIAEQSGLTRSWHAGQPAPEACVQVTEAWESWPHVFGSVFPDPDAGLYRMYYETARERDGAWHDNVCYAKSTDGKRWSKPILGLCEYDGSSANNILMRQAELPNAFIDPLDPDPAGRLKMFVYGMRENPHPRHQLFRSGDGRRWEHVGPGLSLEHVNPVEGGPMDTNVVIWDPLGERYMAGWRTYSRHGVGSLSEAKRTVLGTPEARWRRAIGISTSTQLREGWTPTITAVAADERDDAQAARYGKDPGKPDWAELYVMPFFNYGNHYLGLVSILQFIDGTDRQPEPPGGGDLQLTYSHDGMTWHRQPDRATVIAPSPTPGLFPSYAACNPPLELGDELWLYYSEANAAHPLSPFSASIAQIRAAIWRRDGFASMDSAGEGSLTTPPLAVEGNELSVNVTTGDGGALRVGLLDAQGRPLPGFAAAECEPLTGDQVAGPVRWKGQRNLALLQGKPVRLRFDLVKSRLWSFRFAP